MSLPLGASVCAISQLTYRSSNWYTVVDLGTEIASQDAIEEAIASSPRESFRYFGKNSALSLSFAIRGAENLSPRVHNETPCPIDELGQDLVVGPRMHQFLLQTYLEEIQPIYPFLDCSPSFLTPEGSTPPDLQKPEVFILQMVYSVACHCAPASQNLFPSLSDACYNRALQHIDDTTANLSVITLQAIILLALRSLFEPQKGNFGQLIAFAARLAIDIGGQDIPARGEHMRNIHTTIYCMENQFATVIDRPPFLPEPVSASIQRFSLANQQIDTIYGI